MQYQSLLSITTNSFTEEEIYSKLSDNPIT